MIELFNFQTRAAESIAERFGQYYENRPLGGTRKNPEFTPFYQAIEAITGAGKTAILADTIERMRPVLPVQPFVLWLSKGRVVVAQTYANLQDGGKYRSLLESYVVRLLPEYRKEFAEDDDRAFVFFGTVGTFNDRDRENSDRLIFKTDLDNAGGSSIWEALKKRETRAGLRRPLIVVYDEAQNLSDQQIGLLLELQPDALLVASATMRLPAALGAVVDALKRNAWTDEMLLASIPAGEVVEAGLIKSELRMGGYQSPMSATIDDMLADLESAESDILREKISLKPKCIYVCKTNIVEGNSFERDDANRPFSQREAPPIVIWRYLVEEKGVDPDTIAVYCRLDFKREYPPPAGFRLFKGGDDDYPEFIAGDFRHVIFNLSLQEGWDDPSCYFAYIDKSMGSNVQVEQLVGRLLRQPEAKRLESENLNTAHFYVRVDNRSVFAEVVANVRDRLKSDGTDIKFVAYGPGQKPRPELLTVREKRSVPKVYRDTTAAQKPIADLLDALADYRSSGAENLRGQGYRSLVRQRVGAIDDDGIEWVAMEHSNPVSARWVFARAVVSRFRLALDLCASDDVKFDIKIELGSKAYTAIERLADDVVTAYFDNVRLKQRAPNPYFVGDMYAIPSEVKSFTNALHAGYSGLNPLEEPFAEEIDKTGLTWCRNPPKSGFGLPLLSIGRTKDFYPDFLVWRGDDVYAIDTTGEQLIHERTTRKLLSIAPGKGVQGRLFVKLISPGKYDAMVRSVGSAGYTVWSLRQDGSLGNHYVSTVEAAVELALAEGTED